MYISVAVFMGLLMNQILVLEFLVEIWKKYYKVYYYIYPHRYK